MVARGALAMSSAMATSRAPRMAASRPRTLANGEKMRPAAPVRRPEMRRGGTRGMAIRVAGMLRRGTWPKLNTTRGNEPATAPRDMGAGVRSSWNTARRGIDRLVLAA